MGEAHGTIVGLMVEGEHRSSMPHVTLGLVGEGHPPHEGGSCEYVILVAWPTIEPPVPITTLV